LGAKRAEIFFFFPTTLLRGYIKKILGWAVWGAWPPWSPPGSATGIVWSLLQDYSKLSRVAFWVRHHEVAYCSRTAERSKLVDHTSVRLCSACCIIGE